MLAALMQITRAAIFTSLKSAPSATQPVFQSMWKSVLSKPTAFQSIWQDREELNASSNFEIWICHSELLVEELQHISQFLASGGRRLRCYQERASLRRRVKAKMQICKYIQLIDPDFSLSLSIDLCLSYFFQFFFSLKSLGAHCLKLWTNPVWHELFQWKNGFLKLDESYINPAGQWEG